MSLNRSRLTPTPIVDKNGVRTSRLMKSGTAAPARQPSIPTVSISYEASHWTPGSSVDEVVRLVGPKGGAQYERKFFEHLDEDDPETLPLALQLMTSGSDLARNRTTGMLLYMVSTMLHASEEHRNWRDHCDTSWSPFNKHTLLTAWNACEILSATGSADTPFDVENRVARLDESVNAYSSHGDRSHSNDYWRGLAIIAVSDLNYFALTRDDREHAKDFALWAARQPDPSAVIRVIEERRTLHIDTVRDLIAQQSNSPALGNGVL